MNAKNIQLDAKSFSLFIGRTGSGKSAAAYSYPKPMKIIDLDGRVRGGLNVPWNWEEREGIEFDYIPPKGKPGVTVFEQLNTMFEILLVQTQSGQCPYKTLILDSITWQTIDLLLDAIPLTHGRTNAPGKMLGKLAMAGPEDYGFQAQGTYQIIAFLKSLNIPNIIVTAHLTNKYGKDPNADKYAPNIIVGEQLSLTDKLAENVPSSFDNIFKFSKDDTGSSLRFSFSANGELARSSYPISYGEIDITGKNFYKGLMKMAGVASAVLS